MPKEFETIIDNDILFAKIQRDKQIRRKESNGDIIRTSSYSIQRFIDVLELAKEEGKVSVDFEITEYYIKMMLYESKTEAEFIKEQISQKEIEIEELKRKLKK